MPVRMKTRDVYRWPRSRKRERGTDKCPPRGGFVTRVRSLLPLTGCDGVVGPCTPRDRGQQHGASQQPESASHGSRDTLDTLLTDHRGTGWTRGCATGIPTEGCTESVFLYLLPASSPLVSRHAQTPPLLGPPPTLEPPTPHRAPS